MGSEERIKEGKSIINLPKDGERVSKLRAKLTEYQGRLDRRKMDNAFLPPEAPEFASNMYKIKILSRLLSEGAVNIPQILGELWDEFGNVDMEKFTNAADVIEDYCTTGGQGNVESETYKRKLL